MVRNTGLTCLNVDWDRTAITLCFHYDRVFGHYEIVLDVFDQLQPLSHLTSLEIILAANSRTPDISRCVESFGERFCA
jgi:hypothetical protein